MNNEILTLEKQIKDLKQKELFDKWNTYLYNLKNKLNALVGKTLMYDDRSGSFAIFKILELQEKYYVDREGFYGQWSPIRWIELKTSSWLHYEKFNNNRGKIKDNSYSYFKLYKNKQLNINKLNFHEASLSNGSWNIPDEIYKIGYCEYDVYIDDPNYDRALEFLNRNCFIVPDEIYDDAFKIHINHINESIEFFNKYENVNKEEVKLY